MAKQQESWCIGGGLAGLAAAMKLAELDIPVDLISLVPVRRCHSVCAQGGINAVNELTRQQGDSEWKHFDDTVYGGDFLNHQPPVKEMCDWAPRIIDLMDRLGVTFNRTPEGFRDLRRFGGTLYPRTAFAGATTGQQLLYALDEQVRRWEVERAGHEVRVLGLPRPDPRRQGRLPRRGRPGPRQHGDPRLPGRCGDPRHRRLGVIFGQSTNSTICTGRPARAGLPGRREVRQRRVHPGPPDRHPRRRQAPADERERPRRRRPRLGAAQEGRHPPAASRSPRPSAGTSSKRSTRSTATSCRATSPPARSSRSAARASASRRQLRASTST